MTRPMRSATVRAASSRCVTLGSGGANLPDYVITTMYRDGYHGRKMQWFGIPASELKREIKSELELYLDAGMIKKILDDKLFWTE